MTQPGKSIEREKAQGKAQKGFVYLIGSKYGYKIGRTKNVRSRTRLFDIKLPFPITLIHLIETSDYIRLEKDMHLNFRAKRLEGEWFDLNETDVQAFKNWETKNKTINTK